MKKLGFAVIGLGNIGSRHLAVIDAEPTAELRAMCDIVGEKNEKYSELYSGVPSHEDFRDVLRQDDVDIVNICTPHGLHAAMAIEAAKHGKHILVEKPMALRTSEAEEMIRAAEDNNVRLMVVKQNRYNVPIDLMKKAVEEGRLGKIYMFECSVLWNRHVPYYADSNWRGNRKLEGGALYTQVSHFIDILIWLFGDLVEAATIVDTKMHEIEIEDCGSSALRFSSGVSGSLTWTTCVYNRNYEGSITIIGEDGTVKVGGQYLNKIEFWDVKSYPLPEDIEFLDKPNMYAKYQGTSSNHDKVMRAVVTDLIEERHSVVEGDEGMKTIAAIELIYNSVVG